MKGPLHRQDSNQSRLQVLVVDDSAVARQVLKQILETDPAIQVTTASDPIIAFGKIEKCVPDVIITDLEMPRMDGLTFMRQLLRTWRIPVVVCSGTAGTGASSAMSMLEEGAVEVIARPRVGLRDFLHESAVMLLDAVWSASCSRPRSKLRYAPLLPQPRFNADAVLPRSKRPPVSGRTPKIIAIGSSTGGIEAIRELLRPLDDASPGIVIAQHMPQGFTNAFARRLNEECQIRVKEAVSGDRVQNGCALIAPGNRHMLIHTRGGYYLVEIKDGPLVSRHRPSVDVLFRSVAQAAGANAIGIILTGMGDDGAQGLLEMKQAGATTFAQDENSCVVFGMPKEAIKAGAVSSVLSLGEIRNQLLSMKEPTKTVPGVPS